MKYTYQCLFVCVDHARSEEGDVWFSFARKLFFSTSAEEAEKTRGKRKNKKKK